MKSVMLAIMLFVIGGMNSADGTVNYIQSRPYSFYYPYNFRYYYPQLHVYGSCQLTYINGTFIYKCQ